ncbi:MAG TPA: MBL fold metallo-hydrolase [Anaerolineales bacterium]|jgi:L-ascorbate metabolism protein UlaG (beta-lactamase superfamily)|nr:MBL fold metallo-hydrolase [Anaerolineales bacterium]
MEITWYGHSCFRLTERSYATVVTDPFDSKSIGYSPLRLKSDIVTVSHAAPGHSNTDAVKGISHVIDGAGEFEIGGVFITGVQTDIASNRKKAKDDSARNTIFVFDYDGITVAHLGDLKQTPTQSEIESLGTINVALVPVGGGGGLNAAKAAEVISMLEPNLVVPMHYSTPSAKLPLDALNKFIKEMGLSQTETQPSLKVTRSGLPHETHVVVLEYQTS